MPFGDSTVWVRGTDNIIYSLAVNVGSNGKSNFWGSWTQDFSTETTSTGLVADYNPCSTYWQLAAVGLNNALYGRITNTYNGWSGAGGATSLPAAITWLSNSGAVLVVGSNGIYYNDLDSNQVTGWHGYVNLGGATPSTPAIANLLSAC